MRPDDLFGPISAGGLVILGIGFFVGLGLGEAKSDSKWCKRMKDTTWSECLSDGEQVKVIEDVL